MKKDESVDDADDADDGVWTKVVDGDTGEFEGEYCP